MQVRDYLGHCPDRPFRPRNPIYRPNVGHHFAHWVTILNENEFEIIIMVCDLLFCLSSWSWDSCFSFIIWSSSDWACFNSESIFATDSASEYCKVLNWLYKITDFGWVISMSHTVWVLLNIYTRFAQWSLFASTIGEFWMKFLYLAPGIMTHQALVILPFKSCLFFFQCC